MSNSDWPLPSDVTYLNHGSFGPSPLVVQRAREEWSRRLERQPMDFFCRQMEAHLESAAERMGEFVGCSGRDLLFVENATAGMNLVAASAELSQHDEVLLTDHEYGAVRRLWSRRCDQSGARLVVCHLPAPFTSQDEVVDQIFARVTDRTKLIVFSQVTSPTAVVLPAEAICRRARERGILSCVDGPHSVAMRPVDLSELSCDFFTASCHKWLCGPFGSGFLYVNRRHQHNIKPTRISWGRSVGGRQPSWKDEFTWPGTRDPSAYLAVPTAIEFLSEYGVDRFREETHQLARYAREQIGRLTGLEPIVPDELSWYGSMISLPLPPSENPPPKPGHPDELQRTLWERYGIEVPIVHWKDRRFVRVSCHLYNTRDDIDRLMEALAEQFGT